MASNTERNATAVWLTVAIVGLAALLWGLLA
jgi:hypothetical protein